MRKALWVCLLPAMALTGCASVQSLYPAPKPPPPTPLVHERLTPVPVAPVSRAAPAAVATPERLAPKRVDGRRFDVVASDAPAAAFFEGIAVGSLVNIVVHPEVTGRVTLNLNNVTLEEALDAACDLYGFDYVSRDYGYQVVPRKLQSKVFRVDYLDIQREGRSSTSISSGQVSASQQDSTGQGGSSSSSSTESTETQQSAQINTYSKNEVWKNLEKALQNLVGSEQGRSVVLDPQSGIVVVKALPSELRDVEMFLAKASNSLARQVLIEAKVVEVTLNEGSNIGIQWNAVLDSNGEVTASQASGRATSVLDTAVEGAFALTASGSDFDGVLNLLRAQGDVQVLSSPRIATVNNQKAVIKVGTDEFFVTRVSSNTTTTTTATSTIPEVTLTPFFSGIALDVTPQVSEQDSVILHVHPTVTDVTEKNKVIDLGENTLSLPLAISSVRETDSVIKAANGQVVVIGGLMQNKQKALRSSLAFLGDLPIIGALFNQALDSRVKSELVILLRPRIVQLETADWETSLESESSTAGTSAEELR